ncbi:MAG: hypothetical protein Q9174_002056 [Haloplaca sp. 1 TL-2023]
MPALPNAGEVVGRSCIGNCNGWGGEPYQPVAAPDYPVGTRPFDPAIPAYYDTDDDHHTNVGAIVGGVAGGLAFLVLSYLLYRYLKKGEFMEKMRKFRRRKGEDVEMQHNSTLE